MTEVGCLLVNRVLSIVSGCNTGSNVHEVRLSVKIVLSVVSGCYTESNVHEVCLSVKIVL